MHVVMYASGGHTFCVVRSLDLTWTGTRLPGPEASCQACLLMRLLGRRFCHGFENAKSEASSKGRRDRGGGLWWGLGRSYHARCVTPCLV